MKKLLNISILLKTIILLLAVFYLNSCQQKGNTTITFKKNYLKFRIDTSIIGSVYAYNKIITLKSDGKFICMNIADFSSDTIKEGKLNMKKAIGIYQIFDSLVIVTTNKDYYLNEQFDYIPYNRYKNRFYKSDTSTIYAPWGEPNYIDPLYCDSEYIITQFCMGEFGGTLYFTDRKNHKHYYCPATCACVVNKIKNKYVITNSLAHMDCSSEILEIDDPKTLPCINIDTAKNVYNFWYSKVWDGQSLKRYDSLIGKLRGDTKQILDTFGILIYTSFNYGNEIYHIYRISRNYKDNIPNRNEIYIGKVINNKIEKLDSLGEISIFTYYPKTKIYPDLTLYCYYHERNSGFIVVKNDTINIIEFVR